MRTLTFERSAQIVNGRAVRRAVFERRSQLPVSAACLVANHVRDSLSGMFGAPVSLRLLEPLVPSARAWEVIARDARIIAVHGSATDAALVLRPDDALALAAAAFGEQPAQPRPLSPLEERVVERALQALSGALAAVCGQQNCATEPNLDIRHFATYFELIAERPAELRLGVAVSHDPVGRGRTLQVEDLLDVHIELTAEFASGTIPAGALLTLGAGVDVPMNTKMGEKALLKAAGRTFARAECGAIGPRSALVLEGLMNR